MTTLNDNTALNQEQDAPRLTRFFWNLTWLEAVVLAGAGVLPFVLPDFSTKHAPWQTGPFNMRFVGAVYLASLTAVLMLLRNFGWVVARLALRMLAVFTAGVLVTSVVYTEAFLWNRPLTWAWFALYLILPINAAFHIWKYRSFAAVHTTPHNTAWQAVLTVQGTSSVLYGLMLLIAPGFSTAFWPWAVDALHGRLYSAIFLTLGVAALNLRTHASRVERALLGWTQVVLGVAVPFALIWTDLERQRVNWTLAGVWSWLSVFVAFFCIGMGLLMATRQPRDLIASRTFRQTTLNLTRGYLRFLGMALLAQGLLAWSLQIAKLEPPTWTLGLLEFHALHSIIHGLSGTGLVVTSGRRWRHPVSFAGGAAFGLFYIAFSGSSLHSHAPLGIPTTAAVNVLHFVVGLPALLLGVTATLMMFRERLESRRSAS
jgi:hypothetical protein